MSTNKLRRDPDDKVVSGLLSGIAKYVSIEPWVVRLGFIVLSVVTGGVAILFYFAALFFVPMPGEKSAFDSTRDASDANDSSNKPGDTTQ